MYRRWIMGLALAAVLPFTMLACGDDNDIGDDISNAADDARDTAGDAAGDARDAAEDAASNVAGIAPVTVDLDEQNNSGVSGDAVVTPEGSNTSRVSMNVGVDDNSGASALKAGVWEGDCGGVSGEPDFDLGEVDDGQHTGQVDEGIEELKDGDYVIAIRDGESVAACGAI